MLNFKVFIDLYYWRMEKVYEFLIFKDGKKKNGNVIKVNYCGF